MKVIDLLSINKKEMPKCVKHYSGIYVWDKEEGDFFKGSGEGLLQWCVSSFDTQNHFIDEVEITEENKILMKIYWNVDNDTYTTTIGHKDYKVNKDDFKELSNMYRQKINEIIEILNKMRKDK